MPGNMNQNSQPVRGNPWGATADARNDRNYSDRVRPLPLCHAALLVYTVAVFPFDAPSVHTCLYTLTVVRDQQVNSEPSNYQQSTRSTGDTAHRAWPSNSTTYQSGSTSNPSAMHNMVAGNRTSDAQVYYAMQRWAEQTPKEQPWNGLKHTVPFNKKDGHENGN
ncbi:MAG: hypothetical protein FRX48_05052 [Lasallia pustulata]|uniref:Uncharacterized protein n=1 Tax=Lasallia pustulata TaxID=136370 RepID=A0A5M8PP19_9LECA|nr:MAG: hypothetical protein FRX48_05052 [Lasallia pustulata]